MGFTEFIIILAAFAIGFGIAFFLSRSGRAVLEERIVLLNEQAERASEREKELEEKHSKRAEELSERANRAERELTNAQADLRHLKERLAEQKAELEELNSRFRDEFKSLANDILEEKSKKFTEQNREKLDTLLKPLGEKISEFQKRVEETHKEDIKGRSALSQHLSMLQELNQKMSEEANNLTKALKGDTKKQGNWGEVILERILEKSGLKKGFEYEIQQSIKSDNGRSLQPDVVVYLPDEKRLVIDSKVSLNAYEEYSSADSQEDQQKAIRKHVASIRGHVKNLSSKDYAKLHNEKSPDFVLMFIPIEPAFGVAMMHDTELYNEAFDMNIIIVSPTTLLATLATIENVWKQEYQNKNAMEIASRGGALYDKFTLFVESMVDIGNRIDQTQKSYDEAMTRLSTGAGNLVRQTEMLKELGAKTSKKIPQNLIDRSGSGDMESGEKDQGE
ncbi:MAG: DNA recombination protein RmuC [Balneolaceae bacterium]|nr:DNA recombination protein RmuC [Balneolaceae bacterium]MCH8548499.1 DNA recombination protein RmuC [Balneolaceae bacterium]